ncbi:uncharacterized protein LOC129634548 isoform X3 [Bubalus kerabau]|uniref:uncharacterized protein LOC129634548 isoform X3 n=1 Tax=Bubalus carabanensis TaxID=3119969 RepID=UPI00244EE9F9|nr:uncharacterized protein LOC129634548 isoform X3 [Bubalus carabanensis]
MTFPEDSCKHWTLGCTLRSSWISPGPDHYVAREIAPQRDKKDRACQNQVDLPSSAETRPGPRLPALRLVCVLSTLQWNKKGPSLQEPRVTKSWTRLKRLGTQTLTPRKGPAVNTAEINCKHSQLSRSQWRKVKFPHSLKNKNPKLPQDNMLCIPNITGEMPIKMTTRNQIQPVRMAILTSLQQYMWERAG